MATRDRVPETEPRTQNGHGTCRTAPRSLRRTTVPSVAFAYQGDYNSGCVASCTKYDDSVYSGIPRHTVGPSRQPPRTSAPPPCQPPPEGEARSRG
eukprot:4607199-Prymnesium_polylepis.2